MFGEYDFHLLQIQYLKAAMDQVAAFRPQNMTPAQMQTEYDNGVTTRTNFQTKAAARNLARGEMYEKQADGHQAAIGVYAVMKSRYRKDQGSAEAIGKLPTQDQTVDDSITRMEAMSTLWGQLPNDPFSNPAGPFVAWAGMDKAAFDAKLTTLKTNQAAFVTADEGYEKSQGDLHAKDSFMADLAVAALAEGRGQFAEGTPEREVIDSIPTEPAQQAPAQAVISVATSPAAGQVHLEYDATRATSFTVLQKAPGAPAFVIVADDVIAKVYDANALAPGSYDYKVTGHNSKGDGPESAVSNVAVG